MTDLEIKIRDTGIIPVVKIDDAEKAVDLAQALINGGINAAEVTFRTAAAAQAITNIKKAFPSMLLGAGTVINTDLAEKAIKAGANFIVSPGFNPSVVDYCIKQNVLIIPGVANASNIEQALEKGLTTLKFFPAEQSGGCSMLDALSGPFPQVLFMPTGGINASNVGQYLKRKNVLACGGSWMVKADLITNSKWDEITALCKEAVRNMHGFYVAHVGLNNDTEKEAQDSADLFLSAFGFKQIDNGKKSFWSSDFLEIMKSHASGVHGHIAIKTLNIERALAYLKQFGFNPKAETAQHIGKDESTPLKFIYLDKEISGFAIHLNREN